MESGEWPEDWVKSVFVTIPKKIRATECSDHRTLALISHTSKILLRILLKRMQSFAESEVADVQMGFRPGRGTRDQILNLRLIMEKAREFQQPLYMAFIDYRKAFDRLDHSKLWQILLSMGAPQACVTAVMHLYAKQSAVVRVEGEMSLPFHIRRGVRQGCLLSPMCFNLYSEAVMRESVDELAWAGVSIGGVRVNNLRYADDIVLITTSSHSLQHLVAKLNLISSEYKLDINTSKTKVLTTAQVSEPLNITCQHERLEQVDHFKYLGVWITSQGDCKEEIRSRLGMARSVIAELTPIWKDRAVSKQTKLRLLRTLSWSVATYGCEGWTLTREATDRLEAFEMFGYRKLLRVNWTARRTNASIINELDTQRSLFNTIKRRKLKLFGHLTRAGGLTATLLQGCIEGTRRRGRPRRRWSDDLRDWLQMPVSQLTRNARDRRTWRRWVWDATHDPDPQT